MPLRDDDVADPVAFTCRFTAAQRALETSRPNPILVDPLARGLAGPRALKHGEDWLQEIIEGQGEGKHLIIPARSRLIEDRIAAALRRLSADGQQPVQVVSLGCGMDTRPWRLQGMGPHVRWFDVDQPLLTAVKQRLMVAAGAQMDSGSDLAAAAGDDAGAAAQRYQYPLLCGSYALCAADLSQVPLGSGALLPHGFDPSIPTIWIAEGLLFYIPLQPVSALLHAVADLSATGSLLIVSCIDSQLLEVSRTPSGAAVPGAHRGRVTQEASDMIKGLWHFDLDDLLACDGFGSRWKLREPPGALLDLATKELNCQVYNYGDVGQEYLLAAEVVGGRAAAPLGTTA